MIQRLQKLHEDLMLDFPTRQDCLEVVYVSRDVMHTCRGPLTVISPGEALTTKQATNHWLMNWYLVREHGKALFGPPPTDIIDTISFAGFQEAVREHLFHWQEWIRESRARGLMGYAVVTLCRGLYTVIHGKQVSKKQALSWAEQAYPQWAALIKVARSWRGETAIDPATYDQIRAFVSFVMQELAK